MCTSLPAIASVHLTITFLNAPQQAIHLTTGVPQAGATENPVVVLTVNATSAPT